MLQLVKMEQLPESIQYLVEIIGLPGAEAIVEVRGGIGLCVPKNATADHWIAKRIGLDKLTKLVKIYGGEEIEIARCAAAMRAVRENEIVSSTESNTALARRYGYTERGIRKLKRRVEGNVNDQQRDLFLNK